LEAVRPVAFACLSLLAFANKHQQLFCSVRGVCAFPWLHDARISAICSSEPAMDRSLEGMQPMLATLVASAAIQWMSKESSGLMPRTRNLRRKTPCNAPDPAHFASILASKLVQFGNSPKHVGTTAEHCCIQSIVSDLKVLRSAANVANDQLDFQAGLRTSDWVPIADEVLRLAFSSHARTSSKDSSQPGTDTPHVRKLDAWLLVSELFLTIQSAATALR